MVPLAVAASDHIVFVLLPDKVIPAVFAREIGPALRPGNAVAFGSEYSLAFGLVRVDVQDKGEKPRYLREYLSRVPREIPVPRASA